MRNLSNLQFQMEANKKEINKYQTALNDFDEFKLIHPLIKEKTTNQTD